MIQTTQSAHRTSSINKISDYLTLSKPGITILVSFTTFVGIHMSTHGTLNPLLVIFTLLGTCLVVSGANALNMGLEHERDALMARTKNRPVPAGRLKPIDALFFGVILASIGMVCLAFAVNPIAGLLSAIATITYVFIYTPLKTRSTLCTMVGAIAGAMPPVIGGAAVKGTLAIQDMLLFLILFLWQIPHFLAIATIYREDYKRAGYCMLPVIDPDGSSTTRQTILQALALVVVSLTPTWFGITGLTYFYCALVLGFALIFFATWFWTSRLIGQARLVFRASILYLAILLIVMLVDKL